MVFMKWMHNQSSLASGRSSTWCHDALSDPNSELSKFLFMSATDGDGGSVDPNNMPRIGSNIAWTYCLSLEPRKVRNERIVMMFEANAM